MIRHGLISSVVFALLALAWVADASYAVEEAGLRVVFPPDNKRSIRMAMADFGKPRYGGQLIGNLVYPSSEPGYPGNNGGKGYKCFPEDCQYGCQLNASFPAVKVDRKPGEFTIMLLDRGPRMENHTACYFLDKAYNAQLAGADAVLVANDAPGELSTAVAPEDDDTANELLSLTISAAVITLEDAVFLRQLLRNGPVTVLLNWTSVVPPAPVVSWEFWTNSNDECGFSCNEQIKFIKDMKDRAQALETAGRAKFTPHYMLWNCPAAFLNSTECLGECIMNGTYCAPDPDGNFTEGYTGRDVLTMNLRQLCFYRLAAVAGKGQLWWDYVLAFASQCSMASKSYNLDCAAKVFDQLGGPALAAGNGGRAAWDACASFNETAALAAVAAGNPNATRIPVLEEEVAAQHGNDSAGVQRVSILPTVRVNGRQYRGSLDANSVTRALCAGFPVGQEPSLCNQAAISEDECAPPSGVGYLACMTSEQGLANMTRCVNTFAGYSCECKGGMYKYTNPETGQERCEDVNECLATSVSLTEPDCACPRCACVNAVGSYKCTGPLENKCTAAANYGGCWQSVVQGETFHACVDDLPEFQRLAARGLANATSNKWYRCECPKCFRATGTGGCEPACGPDLSSCDRVTGFCARPSDSAGGGNSKNGGTSAGVLLVIVLASAGLTAVIVLLANRYLMRQRMGDEIRDIMAQYMPLQERERNALLAARSAAAGGGGRRGPGGGIRPDEDSDDEGTGVGAYGWPAARPAAAPAPPAAGALGPLGPLGGSGGAAAAVALAPAPAPAPALVGAGQRAVWGPPPVTAAGPAAGAAKSSAVGPVAAAPAAASAAAARPSVDVFTLGGPDDDPLLPSSSKSSAVAAAAAAPARAASDADPLLGRELGSIGGGAGPAPPGTAKPPSTDNPFL